MKNGFNIMDTTYIIFLLTFLLFPFVGLILKSYVGEKILSFSKLIIAFFLVHNILFFLGFSLEGDYIDYSIFSVEYLFLCFFTFMLYKSENIYAKVISVLGTIGISLGLIIGGIGIFMFIVVSRDYETDKVFHFQNENINYETRRYSFGFATSENTKYTFETYIENKILPFEKKIDKTVFFDSKVNLNIDQDSLIINIQKFGDKEYILFKSSNGNSYSKPLD